jgi:intein/homing endonuclease
VFDVIDTEEKAYWLGFIYADGYIETESNRFGIGISIKDYGHLVKFNSFMKYLGNNIKTKISKQKYKGELKEKEICFWRVSDKHLKESLIKQGCFEKKSLILEFPKIPAKLVKHFIRGYFDGDGCVSYYQNKTYISP